MIRIFVPLILAAAAFFGPWTSGQGAATGADFVQPSVDCLIDLEISIQGECAPRGALRERLAAYTILGSAAAGVLSIVGLLPFIGRLTSLAVIGSGAGGVAAAALTAMDAMGNAGVDGLSSVGWGAWAAAAIGLFAIFTGIGGVRDGNER